MFKLSRKKTDMLNGVIWQQLILFMIPIFLGALFQQLYNTVDAIIVGNVIGKEALGAVGGSTSLVFHLLIQFVSGLATGGTVVIAQYYGNGDYGNVRKGVHSGIIMSFTLGIVLTILGYSLAPIILTMLNVPSDMYAYSLTYMRIFALGMVFTMMYNTGAGILRAVGDSKHPLYFLMVSCFSNIILDILLVVIFPLSVMGAAIATVCAQGISCLLTYYTLMISDDCIRVEMKHMHVDFNILSRIIKIGLPTGIQWSLYSVANLFIQSSVNSYGTDTVAAFTVFNKVEPIFWNFSDAVGTSLLTFSGQNLGNHNIKRIKDGMKQAMVIELIGSFVITGACILAARPIFGLFTQDSNVITIGIMMLKQIGLWWFTFAPVEIFANTARGCGKSFIPMIMILFGIGVVRILWILFYPATTIMQTLICFPLSWAFTSVLFTIYAFKGNWFDEA